MAIVVVSSNTSGAGKTGVAAAIARHYAYAGRAVRLARASGEGNARADAAYFGSLPFAPGSASEPAGEIADPGENVLLVVEAAAGSAPVFEGAKHVLVARGVAPKAASPAPAAVVVTDVPVSAAAAASSGNVIALPEDRALAGFSLDEVQRAINADVLVAGDVPDVTCDHLVIAPIASDAGQPYFRRFGTKAVVVRFDKMDMHLAAMKADPQVLILTGGRRPSDYLFDAAGANGIPVLLSRTDTENTVIALEGIFDETRFQGERKLERMSELLDASPLYELLEL